MKRACERLLSESISLFPCVAIIGPRQCGKTTLLQTLPLDWKRFDLEKQADLRIIANDPDLFFRLNPDRVAIDEAQLVPGIFPALRVAIDDRRSDRGRFVITGSSSPALLRSVSESLAGRVAIIDLSPLSFAEVSGGVESNLLPRLVEGASAHELLGALRPRAGVRAVHDYWYRGGYPEPWLKGNRRFHDRWMDQYVRTYLDRDVARLFPGLDHTRYRLFLQLLAGLSGTTINYSEVGRALGVSQPTVRDYFEIAHGTFLWRRLPPYMKNAVKRVSKHNRGYVRDSGLLHHLLQIPDERVLLAHPQMGRSWEGLVIEEIIRGLESCGVGFEPYYYRTSGGAEVDLVIEGKFGLVPIEIKHSGVVDLRELRSLRDFVCERRCRLGIVVCNDEKARLADNNILSIPFAFL